MLFRRLRRKTRAGFSLIELIVVLITASVMTASVMSYFFRQQRMFRGQKIRADSENLGLIGFFMVGRDIRSAGCNPSGVISGSTAVSVAVSLAQQNAITVQCDRNGDGDLNDPGDQVTYSWTNSSGTEDDNRLQRIEGGGGTDIAIDNVSTFELAYRLRNDPSVTWYNSVTAQRPLINLVRVTIGVGGNIVNPATGLLMKERLYSTTFRVMNLQ